MANQGGYAITLKVMVEEGLFGEHTQAVSVSNVLPEVNLCDGFPQVSNAAPTIDKLVVTVNSPGTTSQMFSLLMGGQLAVNEGDVLKLAAVVADPAGSNENSRSNDTSTNYVWRMTADNDR